MGVTTNLGLKTFTNTDPIDYNEINDNYNKIDAGTAKAMRGKSTWNILDNSDFTNPVAQAGLGGMHGSQRYACDRWWNEYSHGTFTQTENGIIASFDGNHCYMTQKLELGRFVGKPLTLAVKVDENVIVGSCASYASSGTMIVIDSSGVQASLGGDIVRIVVANGSHTISWAALYEGVHNAETLPGYVPKGYSVELAECQRYFWKSPGGEWSTCFRRAGDGDLRMPVNAPAMRVCPSISAPALRVISITVGWVTPTNLRVVMTGTGLVVCITVPDDNQFPLSGAILTEGEIALCADL